MRQAMVPLVLAVLLVGCGNKASNGPVRRTPEEEAFLYGLTPREKTRIDMALDQHSAGEITDKDMVEICSQIHKQALSRLAAEDALEQMASERSRAMKARREREVRILERENSSSDPAVADGKKESPDPKE